MPLDTAHQYAGPRHRRMVVGHRPAQRTQPGGNIVELTVVSRYDLAEPRHGFPEPSHRPAELGHVGRELVELAIVPGYGLADLRQQLVDGCDIGPLALRIDQLDRQTALIRTASLRRSRNPVKCLARRIRQVFLAIRFAEQRRER
jgi:hypothetical protein